MVRKLNVLFISNQGGGAPKSLLNMIKSLRGRVNPIVLFENDWYDYQAFKKEGIECLIVPYRMNMVLDEPGYKTAKWKIHRFIDEWTKNHLAPYCIAKKLKGRNIDIVHTNTGAITIGLAVAKKLQAKHVWHLREFQDIDFGPYLILAIATCVPAYALSYLEINSLLSLVLGALVSMTLYCGYLWWRKDESFLTLIELTPIQRLVYKYGQNKKQ